MLEKELTTQEARELYEAICSLQTAEECGKFMRDLCTLSELRSMIERFQVVKRVAVQEPYRSIASATGASTATITRVAHWLNHGTGGYPLVLERMKQK
ncbi:MAG: YerC/YecD family TrpR-related protein [Candidatus Dojkabacteria bacterium]